MYNPKDIQFVGKHDYDKEAAEMMADSLVTTFSIGIFQWEMKSNQKGMKRSPVRIRVKGYTSEKEKVFKAAENIVKALDDGFEFDRKTITVK